MGGPCLRIPVEPASESPSRAHSSVLLVLSTGANFLSQGAAGQEPTREGLCARLLSLQSCIRFYDLTDPRYRYARR